MGYKDLLLRFGEIQEQAERKIYIYVRAPETLKTAKEIALRDCDAAAKIKELEAITEALKDYRTALAKRYGELETMPYKDALKIERVPHWKKHIEYIVTITRVFEDGTQREELREIYRGKERKAALDRYEEIRKQFPGIESVKMIDKRSWEK